MTMWTWPHLFTPCRILYLDECFLLYSPGGVTMRGTTWLSVVLVICIFTIVSTWDLPNVHDFFSGLSEKEATKDGARSRQKRQGGFGDESQDPWESVSSGLVI